MMNKSLTQWALALMLVLTGCATPPPPSPPHLKTASLMEVLTMPKFDSEFEIPADAWLLSKASAYLENNTLTAEMTGSLLLQVEAIETVPMWRMDASEFSEVNLALRLFDVTRDLIIEKGVILRRQALQRELAAINEHAWKQCELQREQVRKGGTGWTPPAADPVWEQRWQEAYSRLQADPKPILASMGNDFIELCHQRGLTLLQGLSRRDLVSDFLSRQLATPPKGGRAVSSESEPPARSVRFSPPRQTLYDNVTEFDRMMAKTADSDLLLGAMLFKHANHRPRMQDDLKQSKYIRMWWQGVSDEEMIHEARLILRKQWAETLGERLERQMESLQIYKDGVWLESEEISDSIGGVVSISGEHLFRPSEKTFDAIELKLDELDTLRGHGGDCRQLCERHGLLPFEGVFDIAIARWVLHRDRVKGVMRPRAWVSRELTIEALFEFIKWRTGRDLKNPDVNDSVL